MSEESNIVLVGFMGTGKSVVGQRLATRFEKRFVDMDAIIEDRARKTISRIFEEDGEPAFRDMERALVQDLATEANQVIAAGVGIVLDPANIEDFERTGIVICLKATPQTILERVGGQDHRPLIEGGEKSDKILQILAFRRELYDAIEHGIDTTDFTIDEVVDKAAAMYESVTTGH